MTKYKQLSFDDIDFEGTTREDKQLRRELLDTILELNYYQDNYDRMKTVSEIKVEVEKLEKLIHEDYVPESDRNTYVGSLKALIWVLNNSLSVEEKEAKLPKASKEEVARIVKHCEDKYRQLTIFDLGDNNDKSN